MRQLIPGFVFLLIPSALFAITPLEFMMEYVIPANIYAGLGMEGSAYRFYTKRSGLPRSISNSETTRESGVANLSDIKRSYSPLYTLIFEPNQFIKLGRSFSIRGSINLEKHGVQRGVIYNYPDTFAQKDNIQLVLFGESVQLPRPASAQIEYSFNDFQVTLALYPLYFRWKSMSFGLGADWGYSYYDLELFETQGTYDELVTRWYNNQGNTITQAEVTSAITNRSTRVSKELNVTRNIAHYNALFFLNLGFMGEGCDICSRTDFFVYWKESFRFKHPLKVNKWFLRSDNSAPPELFLLESGVRIGIRIGFSSAKGKKKKQKPAEEKIKVTE